MRDLIRELKRRKVFRVGAAYVVVAWVVVEAASVLQPHLHLPSWTTTLVIVLAVLAFPIALVMAWALELTPEGLRATPVAPEGGASGAPPAGTATVSGAGGARTLAAAPSRSALADQGGGLRRSTASPPPEEAPSDAAGGAGGDHEPWRRVGVLLQEALERDLEARVARPTRSPDGAPPAPPPEGRDEPPAAARTAAAPASPVEAAPATSADARPRTVDEPEGAKRPPRGDVLAQGERRHVCICVVHLAGFPELVERLDPSRLDELVAALRADAEAVVERHGGVVNAFSGEEFTCLFGVPRTYGDDAARAVRAALELREHLGRTAAPGSTPYLRPRIGIETGLVTVQPLDRGERRYRVVGAWVRGVDRLAAYAGPDEVLIGPDCRRLVAPFVETAPAERLLLGDGGSVVPHRVIRETGPGSRLDGVEPEGLSAFSGREEELRRLEASLERATAGEGQFVTLIGDAGTGKSRLLHEVRRRIDGARVTVVTGRCRPYGTTVPYLPFVEALRDRLGLAPTGQAPEPEEVAAALREVDPELADFLPFYLHLLSISGDAVTVPDDFAGSQREMAIREALAAFFTLDARSRPVVLFLEDWHWADQASGEALRQLADMVSSCSLLIVLTARPEGAEDWGRPANHVSIPLEPLDAEASARIARSVLGAEEVPRRFVAWLHERTGGNPLFVEEVCRSLLEGGTLRVVGDRAHLEGTPERLELPDTLQGVVRARLDRLDRDARELLLVASVVGREFDRGLLERVTGGPEGLEPLDRLRDMGLVQQVRVLPEPAYRFRHVLTQEVAYATLLHHQRRTLHGRVGRALEEMYTDRIEENLDLLAHHFGRAEEWETAIRYARDAARRAAWLTRASDALRTLERALEWCARLPDGPQREELRTDLLFRLERACEALGLRDRQEEIIAELVDRLREVGDECRLAEAYVRRGDLHVLLHRFEEAEASLAEALKLRRRLGDPEGERNALRSLGLLRWYQGRNREAIAIVEEAFRIDRRLEDVDGLVGDLLNLGNLLRSEGEHEAALERLRQALSLEEGLQRARAGWVPFRRSLILGVMGSTYRDMGDLDRALEHALEADEVAAAHRLEGQRPFFLTGAAHIHLKRGEVEESLRLYAEAVDVARRVRHAEGLAQSLRTQGEVLVALGRCAEGAPPLEEAAGLYAQLRDPEAEAAVWSRLADACEREREGGRAFEAWSRARELRTRLGDAEGELLAAEGMARTARASPASGRPDAAALYEDTLRLARELGREEKAGELLNVLGILAWERGDYEEALERYGTALDIFLELGDDAQAGVLLNSLGVTLARLGRGDEAEGRLREGLELHRRSGERLLEGHALAALGDLYAASAASDRGAEAEDCYRRSLAIRRELEDRRGEGWMLLAVARIALARGEAPTAAEEAARALALAEEIGDREMAEACRELAEACTELRGSPDTSTHVGDA